MFSSITGLIHLLFSILALITGTMVLVMRKGTKKHKKVGYVYAVSMLGVNGTAFMLYNLFGTFGIFHWAAVVSTLSLFGGMIPVLRKKSKNYLAFHFSFMYWSVMGLYAAFVSEVVTRVPETPFFGMVGIGTGVVMLAAYWGFHRNKDRWFEKWV